MLCFWSYCKYFHISCCGSEIEYLSLFSFVFAYLYNPPCLSYPPCIVCCVKTFVNLLHPYKLRFLSVCPHYCVKAFVSLTPPPPPANYLCKASSIVEQANKLLNKPPEKFALKQGCTCKPHLFYWCWFSDSSTTHIIVKCDKRRVPFKNLAPAITGQNSP